MASVSEETCGAGRLVAGVPSCTPSYEHALQTGVSRDLGSTVRQIYDYDMVLSSSGCLVNHHFSWGLGLLIYKMGVERPTLPTQVVVMRVCRNYGYESIWQRVECS